MRLFSFLFAVRRLTLNAPKRAVSFILACVMAAAVFGGCAQNNEDNAAGDNGKTKGISDNGSDESGDKNTHGGTSGEIPLLWLVTAPNGQTMYLFGSIHAADESIYPMPDVIMDVFNSCDYIAVEFDQLAFEQDMDAVMAMNMSMMYLDGRTVADDIGEDLHQRARDIVMEMGLHREMGVPIGYLDMFKPYLWISILQNAAVGQAGMNSELGMETYFLNQAAERGMGILEVESMEAQMEMLLGFSMPMQIIMLEGALDVEYNARELRELYELWKQGDEEVLEALLSEEDEEMPSDLADEYYYAMYTQRDLQMLDAAELYMAEGMNVFYMVGLAHMLREDGLIEMLRQRGYTVERVR